MTEFNKWMIDPKDAVMLLVDHQSGLFQLVKDIDLPKLRANAAALSKVAHLAKLPTFTTASVPEGPNGPLIPEIHGNNPDAVYIPRTGQINAWDNPKWVEAIEKTGRKTLIIAGTLTSVCMAFPTLSAVAAGYKVFSVVDASGNWSSMATGSRSPALFRPVLGPSTPLPFSRRSWEPGIAPTRWSTPRS